MNVCGDHFERLRDILGDYGLAVTQIADGAPIPGSFWGEPEAGLRSNCLFVRMDTPLHSALHEACHYVCMDNQRRSGLDTDAGGEFIEESAVCYLQILLADRFDGVDGSVLCDEMDAWGYTFRLGSAARWFNDDAGDAREWLIEHGVIDGSRKPTGRRRD